ncbi:MAG: nucleotidyltransferase domain-containing protein [bacterium]
MSKIKVKKIIGEYAKKLRQEKFPIEAIYLFGSFSKNNPSKWSDIDIAVISEKFKKNWDYNESLLWEYARKVDTRIEPIGLTNEELREGATPLTAEIKKKGVRII